MISIAAEFILKSCMRCSTLIIVYSAVSSFILYALLSFFLHINFCFKSQPSLSDLWIQRTQLKKFTIMPQVSYIHIDGSGLARVKFARYHLYRHVVWCVDPTHVCDVKFPHCSHKRAVWSLDERRALLIKPVGIGTAEAIVPVLIKVGAALMYIWAQIAHYSFNRVVWQ